MTIKELRASTGLSQAKFAERYSIPVRTLQGWECGRRNPPAYALAMLEKLVKEDQRWEGDTPEAAEKSNAN